MEMGEKEGPFEKLKGLDYLLTGAGDGIRTHDVLLGKQALYRWVTPAINYIIKLEAHWCQGFLTAVTGKIWQSS